MKVIFLDMDGVMNRTKTPNPRKFPYVCDPHLVRRLLRLVERTGAAVVLSSTWRYDPVGRFAARNAGIHFREWTPDLPHKPREAEIKSWLLKHPRVKRFIVIDDEDDGLDGLPLFQPSSKTGLTRPIADAAERYLQGLTDKDRRLGIAQRLVQNVSNILRGHPG